MLTQGLNYCIVMCLAVAFNFPAYLTSHYYADKSINQGVKRISETKN